MHLRYLTSARLPTEKAHGIQIVSMCHAFATEGATVELIVPDRFNHRKKPDDIFEYYGITRAFSIGALPITDLTPFAWLFGKFAYALLFRSYARAALRHARTKPADLYYIRDEQTFIAFAEAGLPTVFEAHTVPNKPERFKEAFLKCIAVISISNGLRDELIKLGVPKDKIIVSPDGVDLKRFAPSITKEDARKMLSIKEDRRIALYTGQLFPWKGVTTLIDAASSLPENCEVLVVGGGGGFESEMRKRAKAHRARVRFEGQKNHNDIPRYLAAADCVVIPTSGKEKIGSHYTSPLKLFEAMAMGKAIIASDLPSLREILDDTSAAFFTADDEKSLSAILSSLLRDPRRSAKLGATARDRVFNYSWENRAKNILSAITRLDRTL